MATKGDREAEREITGGEMEGANKRKKKGRGGEPIIFKELRTGPRTRISKMENAGIHHAVGRYVALAYELLL